MRRRTSDNRGPDHLGLFDDVDDDPGTGEVDLTELREALARHGGGAPARGSSVADDPAGSDGSDEFGGLDGSDDPDGTAGSFGHDHSDGSGGSGGSDARNPRSRTAVRREERARERRRRTRRIRSSIIAILVMLLILAGVTVGVVVWHRSGQQPTDWAGTGTTVVVVRVQSGDGLADVAQTLVGAGVVVNAETFVKVASGDPAMKRLQPGFYAVHEHSSSRSVVSELTNPDSRVGRMRVIPGQTLADITTVSTSGKTSTKPGILTQIAKACLPTNGAKSCFSVDDLWKVAESADPNDLGVVGWAADEVSKAPEPRKRLEGLILPGDYDIAPGSTAKQALTAVVSASAAQWNTTGIVAAAKAQQVTPYQMATIASLIQSEGLPQDMPKISRVIYNRLADRMKLQLDSTVNYGLNRAQISTTESERLDPSNIYSTYAHQGLPPTPIGSPGPSALDAAAEPADGTWLYFVAVDTKGDTCFSTTEAQHNACVAKARANGVFG